MEFTGEFVNASKDWKSGKWNITFTCEDESALQEIDEIKDAKLNIVVKKHRNKRSLDSNAYAWVLMQKIAEEIGKSKWEVYLDMLQRYSKAFTHLIVKPNAVDAVMSMYRTAIDLGEIVVNGQRGHQLQVYFGSSTFNTDEMQVFLTGIVETAKEMGIQTETPEEIARMNATWDIAKKN